VNAVKHTRGKAARQHPLAKAIADLERIERELARTQNRWQKQRALVKRLEAREDKRWAERGLLTTATNPV
jgi:phage shock protein A